MTAKQAWEQYNYLSGHRQYGLWAIILISLVLHGAMLVGMVTYSRWANSATPISKKIITTKLVRKGKPRDKRLLPQIPTAPKLTPKTQKAVSITKKKPTKKKPAVKRKKKKKKNKNKKLLAAKRKKEEKKKKTQRRQEEQEKRRQDMNKFINNIRKQVKIKREAEGKQDGSPEGNLTSEQKEIIGNIYLTKLRNKILANYTLPKIITAQEKLYLTAEVILYLDSRGNVINIVFHKTSDNKHFNNALISAIKNSEPFPPPPTELVGIFRKEGALINFKP